jgi:hypothetical protein
MPYSYIPYQAGINVVDPEPAGIPASSINCNFRVIADHIVAYSGAIYGSIGCNIDAGAAIISSGHKGYLSVPYDCTILSNTLIANTSGSAILDIRKCAYGDFPTTTSIIASAPPTLNGQISTDTTLTGWTTDISTNDILEFKVNSCSLISKLSLILKTSK